MRLTSNMLLLGRRLLTAGRLLDVLGKFGLGLIFIDWSGWLVLNPADASIFFVVVFKSEGVDGMKGEGWWGGGEREGSEKSEEVREKDRM